MFIIDVPEKTHSQYIKNPFINKKDNSSVEKRRKNILRHQRKFPRGP